MTILLIVGGFLLIGWIVRTISFAVSTVLLVAACLVSAATSSRGTSRERARLRPTRGSRGASRPPPPRRIPRRGLRALLAEAVDERDGLHPLPDPSNTSPATTSTPGHARPARPRRPTTLPSKVCSSRKPSPVTTRSAPSMRSSRSSSSATSVEARAPARPRRAARPAGQAARRAGALELGDVDAVVLDVDLGQALEAAAQQLDLRRRGALLRREHLGGVDERVRTSQATTSSTPRSRCGGRTAPAARRARRRWWPSRPRPTMIRRAPASTAAAISSPVPWVEAAIGSLPAGAADQREPRRPAPSRSPRCPGRAATRASTGSPSGPVTIVVRLAPPSTSRVPSPPSAMGTSSQSPAALHGTGRRPPPPRPPWRCHGTCRGLPRLAQKKKKKYTKKKKFFFLRTAQRRSGQAAEVRLELGQGWPLHVLHGEGV